MIRYVGEPNRIGTDMDQVSLSLSMCPAILPPSLYSHAKLRLNIRPLMAGGMNPNSSIGIFTYVAPENISGLSGRLPCALKT